MSNIQSRILKDRIDIFEELESKNAMNEDVKTYQYSFNDRTETTFVVGAEKMAGKLSYADKVMRFKVRFHLTRYNERQHILYRGDYYNIRNIDPDRDRKLLVLTAQRVPTDSITIYYPSLFPLTFPYILQ